MVQGISFRHERPSERHAELNQNSQGNGIPDDCSEVSFESKSDYDDYYSCASERTGFTNFSKATRNTRATAATDRTGFTRYSTASTHFTRGRNESSHFTSGWCTPCFGNGFFPGEERIDSCTRGAGCGDTRDTDSVISKESYLSLEDDILMEDESITEQERMIRNYAAIIIQSQVRGMISREHTQELIHQRDFLWWAAAVIIQSQVRGVLAREKVESMKNKSGRKKMNLRGLFRITKSPSVIQEKTVGKAHKRQIKDETEKTARQPENLLEQTEDNEELYEQEEMYSSGSITGKFASKDKTDTVNRGTSAIVIQSGARGMLARAKVSQIREDLESDHYANAHEGDSDRVRQLAGELTDEHFFFDYFCSSFNSSRERKYEDKVFEAYGVRIKDTQGLEDPYLSKLNSDIASKYRESKEEYEKFVEGENGSKERFGETEKSLKQEKLRLLALTETSLNDLSSDPHMQVKVAAWKLLRDQLRMDAATEIQAQARGLLARRKFSKMKDERWQEKIAIEAKKVEWEKRHAFRQLASEDKFYSGIREDCESVESDKLLRILQANLNPMKSGIEKDKSQSARKSIGLEQGKSQGKKKNVQMLSTTEREKLWKVKSAKAKMAIDKTEKKVTRNKPSAKAKIAVNKSEKKVPRNKPSSKDKIAVNKTEKTAPRNKPSKHHKSVSMSTKTGDREQAKSIENTEVKKERMKQILASNAKKKKPNKRGNLKTAKTSSGNKEKSNTKITIIDRKSGEKVS
mmetsp:Transcript_10159/g.14251  ORF Transcript_10159/g.14251 Transcript_10159/m.14251 type:complete len:747 (-) Transcript_10159:512-2752(-)